KMVEGDWNARRAAADRLRQKALPEVDPSEPVSLAGALVRRNKPLPLEKRHAMVNELRRLLALHQRATGPKPDAALLPKLETEQEKWLGSFTGKPLDTGKPLELAWVVLELAREDRLSPSELGYVASLLAKGKVPAFRETRVLIDLAAKPVPEQAENWPAEG